MYNVTLSPSYFSFGGVQALECDCTQSHGSATHFLGMLLDLPGPQLSQHKMEFLCIFLPLKGYEDGMAL